MALKFHKTEDAKPTPTGLEFMLRSLGLGDVIAMAQELATSGTLEKIIKFADGVEELNVRLARIEIALGTLSEPQSDLGHGRDEHFIGRIAQEPRPDAGRILPVT